MKEQPKQSRESGCGHRKRKHSLPLLSPTSPRMKSNNRGNTRSLSQNGIKKYSDKRRIRPGRIFQAVGALHTISSTSQVQTRVPVADMSPGEPQPSGQILNSRALPSHVPPTQLPSPVTDNDTDQDTTVEATAADENSVSIWVDSIKEGVKQLKVLYCITKDNRPDSAKKCTRKEIESYIRNMRAFLVYLKHEVEPSPVLKDLGLDVALGYILGPNMETFKKMAPDLLLLAKRVLDKYEADGWGVDFTNHQGEESEEDDLGSAVATASTRGEKSLDSNSSDRTQVIKLPPVSHPIWGLQGIMHGVALRTTKTGRSVRRLDPRYHNEQRNPKHFGHNSHKPGAWWAFMMAALFHGAHGSPQAGITGHAKLGAYSIVVSADSVYRDLNEDKGTELWYSADKSTENANPLRLEQISNPTRSLEISLKTGKPVRVLRKAGKTSDARRNTIYPTVGIRYDGLYKVMAQGTGTNKRQGVFKKFKLVRLPDSENDGVSWEEVQRYPTREQLRQFDQIKDGY
ncbi:PUA-like domain-containing protein [Pseudoneurospora amorphoporcata]|uniref:PUA-like domain-containing protein n=1 Tax=Pseudoneurospora amorphoporcata TaxID=241081 RepID=A0AAN6NWA8_9PEZI|nr:PUA-like domain-containing protein [Pseudoneurospora amorphoporcata]